MNTLIHAIIECKITHNCNLQTVKARNAPATALGAKNVGTNPDLKKIASSILSCMILWLMS